MVKNQKDQQVKKYGARVKRYQPAFADIDALFKDLLIDTKTMQNFFFPAPSFFSIKEKWMTILRIIIIYLNY